MRPKITPAYLASQGLSETFAERFWDKVKKTKTCWLWTAATQGSYGEIGRWGEGSGYETAHRASWILNRGPIPKGKYVLHNCPGGDNKLCVNPSHLYLGNMRQNGFDASIKCQITAGEKHWNRKLSWRAVAVIRDSELHPRVLAELFGVGEHAIRAVLAFRRWKFKPQ